TKGCDDPGSQAFRVTVRHAHALLNAQYSGPVRVCRGDAGRRLVSTTPRRGSCFSSGSRSKVRHKKVTRASPNLTEIPIGGVQHRLAVTEVRCNSPRVEPRKRSDSEANRARNAMNARQPS